MTIEKLGSEIELGCDFCGESYSPFSATPSGAASVHGLARHSGACPATEGGDAGEAPLWRDGGFSKARDEMKADAKADGWRCFKRDGKWHDSCPECVSEWSESQRGQGRLF